MKNTSNDNFIEYHHVPTALTTTLSTKSFLEIEHSTPETHNAINKTKLCDKNAFSDSSHNLSIPEIHFISLPDPMKVKESKNENFEHCNTEFQNTQLTTIKDSKILISEKQSYKSEKTIPESKNQVTPLDIDMNSFQTYSKSMLLNCPWLQIDFSKMVKENEETSNSVGNHGSFYDCSTPPNAPAPDLIDYENLTFSSFHSKRRGVSSELEKTTSKFTEYSVQLKNSHISTILNADTQSYMAYEDKCEHQVPRTFSMKTRDFVESHNKPYQEIEQFCTIHGNSKKEINNKAANNQGPYNNNIMASKTEKKRNAKQNAHRVIYTYKNNDSWNI